MRYVFLQLTLFLMVSCVGTVEDAKVKMNDLFSSDKGTLKFEGLAQARAISHNKVELEFYPSAETDPNIKYYLYVNGSVAPIEINPSSFDKAAGGKYRYLVDDLSINTTYKFRMAIKNTKTQAESKNERELTAKTFDNQTADFKGISSVSKINGQSDTSFRVDWVPAKMQGSTTAGPYDPYYYEITVISTGGPSNLSNPNYTGTDKKVFRVPRGTTYLSPFNYFNYTSDEIGSLSPNTTYYVQVRAINKLYETYLKTDGISIIPVDKEANTKFLTITTDPSTGLFDFNVESFKASPAAGVAYKTRVDTSWIPASGSYKGYRLFYLPCTGQCSNRDEVLSNDLLTDEKMDQMLSGNVPAGGGVVSYLTIKSSMSSYQKDSLNPYTWYQMKLVACKNETCTKSTGTAIVSSLRAVRTEPTLSSFTGVYKIDHPDSSEYQDNITLRFDKPDTATGYADRLEFFCIDPNSVTPAQTSLVYSKLSSSSALSGSPVARCNGLRLCGPENTDCASNSLNYDISTTTSLKVKGIKTDGTMYCFAAFPAIRDEIESLPTADSTKDWVIRCISPIVKTPTISEFPGFTSGCSVNQNKITLNWNKPIAGIYNAYRVFWRPAPANENFSFSQATKDLVDGKTNTINSAYSTSATLNPDTLTYEITDLRPGMRYKIGILTQTTSGQTQFSEFNTSVRECVTQMPKFKFTEWTRVFAIGPKTDGRFPTQSSVTGATTSIKRNTDSYIYEAINQNGIPYELPIKTDGTTDITTGFLRAPGHYAGSYSPAAFTDDFDGALAPFSTGGGTLIAASNKGIVSLAWKEVGLDFLESEFKDCQLFNNDTPSNTYCHRDSSGNLALPSTKVQRRYGYKVYRSSDNRLTWQDVTSPTTATDTLTGSHLIYARPYSYYKRPDLAAETSDRMAFFTDYSVRAIETDPTTTSRARIYWYKIVPYFDNKPLALDSSQASSVLPQNVIKVILPPANMALVNRLMANRQTCNEIGRDGQMEKEFYYRCPFNGFGARPKGAPWGLDNSVVDLGGDLLVDRFELGCQFTRGDVSASPVSTGNSYFYRSNTTNGYVTNLPTFKGYATDVNGNDVLAKALFGCASPYGYEKPAFYETLDGQASSPTTANSTNYRKFIHGDCMGLGYVKMADAFCTNPLRTARLNYVFPGATSNQGNNTESLDCSVTTANNPSNKADLLNTTFRRNLITQGEFAAVYYHRTTVANNLAAGINPEGPSGNTINWDNNETTWGKNTSCYINLASIDTDGTWRARWFGASDLEIIKNGASSRNIIHDTIDQVRANTTLYNTTNFKAPDSTFWNANRFNRSTTKLGRILTSNSAKLPPLKHISPTAAQSICQTYDVDVGFSTDGSNFLSWGLPKTKRLLGRRELVLSGMWPETGDNGYAENYNYTDTNIRSLESGSTLVPGSCVSSTKNPNGLGASVHGDPMVAISAQANHYYQQASANRSGVLFTGSSDNDGTTNSDQCISRFGVQDVVGNVMELTTDQLYCDYGRDKLWYGKVVLGDGDKSLSAILESFNVESDIRVWTGAQVTQQNTVGPDTVLISGVGTDTGQMWPEVSSQSGYCSIVDSTDPGANYGTAALNSVYRDSTTDFFNGIYAPDGSLNTTIVKTRNPVYQDNVDLLRNGDGYFLSFGSNAPGPVIQYSNSLAFSDQGVTIKDGVALGTYFNPLIGMMLSCVGATCGTQSADNKLFSTPYFIDVLTAPKPDDPSATKFPIGNSQFFNVGISETVFSNGAPVFKRNLSDPAEAASLAGQVITGIRIKLDGSVDVTQQDWFDWVDTSGKTGDQYFSKAGFIVPRGAPLQVGHGGDASKTFPGRFSGEIYNGERVRSQRTSLYPGVRCGVMIKE